MQIFKLADGKAKDELLAIGGEALVQRVEFLISEDRDGLLDESGTAMAALLIEEEKDDLHSLLMSGFLFAHTDEGHKYWFDMANPDFERE